jgi:hypothetical protein
VPIAARIAAETKKKMNMHCYTAQKQMKADTLAGH